MELYSLDELTKINKKSQEKLEENVRTTTVFFRQVIVKGEHFFINTIFKTLVLYYFGIPAIVLKFL